MYDALCTLSPVSIADVTPFSDKVFTVFFDSSRIVSEMAIIPITLPFRRQAPRSSLPSRTFRHLLLSLKWETLWASIIFRFPIKLLDIFADLAGRLLCRECSDTIPSDVERRPSFWSTQESPRREDASRMFHPCRIFKQLLFCKSVEHDDVSHYRLSGSECSVLVECYRFLLCREARGTCLP